MNVTAQTLRAFRMKLSQNSFIVKTKSKYSRVKHVKNGNTHAFAEMTVGSMIYMDVHNIDSFPRDTILAPRYGW